ncbi:MAG: heme exporter protein CcmD [Alphaproteobacteria bacterium]|nr:heme exporter protein CcmD [Alphaproteobacteria bacterium]
MSWETPYLFYILSAYGFTLFSLIAFLWWNYKDSKK